MCLLQSSPSLTFIGSRKAEVLSLDWDTKRQPGEAGKRQLLVDDFEGPGGPFEPLEQLVHPIVGLA
jgi:hypothetical protein